MSLEKVLERLAHLTGAGSDAELARELNVSRQSLSKWRSRGTIPYEKLQAYAEGQGQSLDYLLMGKESEVSSAEIDEDLFQQVWSALRADNSQLNKLSGDLLIEQAILIYNQVVQIDDPGVRAKTLEGAIKLLNSISFKAAAETARTMAEHHPGLVDTQETEQFAKTMDERAQEAERDSGGLDPSVRQRISGSNHQVAGRDIQNHGDHRGGSGGKP